MRLTPRTAGSLLIIGLVWVSLTGFEWEGSVRRLTEELRAGDANQRREVVRRLGSYSPSVVGETLVVALDDDDPTVRAEAAAAAGRIRLAAAVPTLLDKLDDPSAAVRAGAALALGALGEAGALPTLVRGLGDADAEVRRAVVRALVDIGGADVVVPLLGRLDDDDATVRAQAAEALGTLGDAQAVVPLIGRSRDSIPEVRSAALEALGALGDGRARGAIRQGLRDGVEPVQLAAVRAAGRLRSEEIIDALEALLSEPNPRRHRGVLLALGHIGGERGVGALVAALDRTETRAIAVEALARASQGEDGPRVVRMLSDAYRQGGGPGRYTAIAQAFERIGARRSTRDAAPVLLEALRTSRGSTQAVLRALAATGAPEALVPILVRLPDPDDSAVASILDALELLFERLPPDGRAADPLLAVIGEASPPNRLRIVRLLGKVRSPRAIPTLRPLLAHDDPPLRKAATQALGMIGEPHAAADLLAMLDDPDAEMRFEAARALGRIAESEHVAHLVDRLRGRTPVDRHALLLALGEALPRLATIGDLTPAVADAAGQAVRQAMRSRDEAFAARAIDCAARWSADSMIDALLETLAHGTPVRRRAAGMGLAAGRGKGADARIGAVLRRVVTSTAPLSIRAAAAASLGEYGEEHGELLLELATDGAFPVDAAAAFGVARLARRSELTGDETRAALCRLARHRGPFVRANAAVALAANGITACDGGPDAVEWLEPQHAAAVRAAAAQWLGATGSERPAPQGRQAASDALARCADRELSESVRAICASPTLGPLDAEADVYAYDTDGETLLVDRLVVLQLSDGTALVASSDANGHLRWPTAPDGTVSLIDPFAVRLEP